MKKSIQYLYIAFILLFIISCESNSQNEIPNQEECISNLKIDRSRGKCDETLNATPTFVMNIRNGNRIIITNNIPNHDVGLFGKGKGSLNPNAISVQSAKYILPENPTISSSLTSLLNSSGSGRKGPQYSFGILINGVELDPIAAEPFPHKGTSDPNANWKWNKEALNVNLGLDCNNAHVQPNGKYHYHGKPTGFLDKLAISKAMKLIGYAADGFPIYYKYAYKDQNDNKSEIIEMKSSYQLKSGKRSGDGITAPCGIHDGAYSNDYEYVKGLGTLDEANGRNGVTPEFPKGTYYYVLTDDFPSIPRYFRGTPSDDFKIGR